MSATEFWRPIVRLGQCMALAAVGLFAAPQSRADMMLLSQTTLVTGTESTVVPFTIPSPGSVQVTLSNIAWPQSLESLSFMLSSSDDVLGSWSTSSSSVQSYNVTPGTYFAHVTGTAAGSLDLGLYSISVSFQPAGVVPLPASGVLLLCGVLGWLFMARSRREGAPDSHAPAFAAD